MRIRILGAAAGGGLPQWNCNCPNCRAARSGDSHVVPRTQSSVAVSADGCAWFILNLSPDIRTQIHSFPPLSPQGDAPRGTGIAGAILTDAEIDHTLGLLLLREGCPFPVHSTPTVRRWLNRYLPIEPVVSRFTPRPWVELIPGEPCPLRTPGGDESGLTVTVFELDSHLPRFVTDPSEDPAGAVAGLIIEGPGGGRMVYAPGVARITPGLRAAAEKADLVMIDGTFWTGDEMIRLGLGTRDASDMGHLPVGDAGGSLEWLSGLAAARKVYLHINNTNPMLNDAGPEAARVREAGISIGRDGDEFGIG